MTWEEREPSHTFDTARDNGLTPHNPIRQLLFPRAYIANSLFHHRSLALLPPPRSSSHPPGATAVVFTPSIPRPHQAPRALGFPNPSPNPSPEYQQPPQKSQFHLAIASPSC